jgi:HK97 gp10 family phage protein
MKVTVSVDGLRQLDNALAQLPRSLQKGVLKRTLAKAGQPIADRASELAPRDTGELASSMAVSSKIKGIGGAEFAAVMRSGGSKAEAVAAMRGARRAAKATASTAVMFVGPTKAKSKKDAIKRIVQEFGSVKQAARPYMRPAWDAEADHALEIIKEELGNQIIATARRVGRSKKYTGDVKLGASMAALLAHETQVA